MKQIEKRSETFKENGPAKVKRRPVQLELNLFKEKKEVKQYISAVERSLHSSALILTNESKEEFAKTVIAEAKTEGKKGNLSAVDEIMGFLERTKGDYMEKAERAENAFEEREAKNYVEILETGISVLDRFIDGVIVLGMFGKDALGLVARRPATA